VVVTGEPGLRGVDAEMDCDAKMLGEKTFEVWLEGHVRDEEMARLQRIEGGGGGGQGVDEGVVESLEVIGKKEVEHGVWTQG